MESGPIVKKIASLYEMDYVVENMLGFLVDLADRNGIRDLKSFNDKVVSYFSTAHPVCTIGGGLMIFGTEDMFAENCELDRGEKILRAGLVSIGKEADGSQFCCHLTTGKVFHLVDFDNIMELNGILAASKNSWSDINDFLCWFLMTSEDLLD